MIPGFFGIQRRIVVVLVATFLLSASVHAQQTSTVNWTQLPGTAIDLSINAEGQAYSVSLDGTPWRWDKAEQRWRQMSGKFIRISAAEGNRPWAVSGKGEVQRYNGLWWETKDKDVADVAADTVGNVYIAKTDGSIKKWNPLRSEWRPIDGDARRISLDRDGRPWVVTMAGSIKTFDGKAWITFPGRALDIAAVGPDAVVIADHKGLVRTFNKATRRWDIIKNVQDAVAVALTPDGGPWAVTGGGAIMAMSLLVPVIVKAKEIQAPGAQATGLSAQALTASNVSASSMSASSVAPASVSAPVSAAPVAAARPVVTAPPPSPSPPSSGSLASTDPAAVTAEGNIVFVDTLKSASTISIGKNGSVFALNQGRGLVRWSNTRKRFEDFPGSVVRIAVDPEGHPWGITALGRVFRHTGKKWNQIVGATGAEIAIGSGGDVMITDASGALYRLNDAGTRFDRVTGSGSLIAVSPIGVPWTVRPDGLVQRCDTNPCSVLAQKAKSISVGPDNSVWIVSDSNFLMRLKDDGASFEVVQVPGHTPSGVAIGPNGYPWIVTGAGKALASHYFERDESDDQKVVAATGDTVGTGSIATVAGNTVSGFSFSKNMQFETAGADIFSSGSYVVLDAGNDGQIWGAANSTIGIYNTSSRKFNEKTLSLSSSVMSIYDFAVASNGDVWAYISTSFQEEKLYRERNNTLKEYTVSGYTIGGVTVTPDDSVYAIFYTGGNYYIYKKPATSEIFTRLSNDGDPLDLAVGPANDLWVVDRSNIVYQWTGSKFEKRPASGQKASNISVGADGTVYILDTSNALRKWNAANKSFDVVNNITGNRIAIDDDGRPWLAVDSTPTVKRAKE
ncbi:MAG: hypothetical protein HQ492_06705 [Woeseiaceae bacterium]|nr:hypothetical protein [Woeseiaceae bacterium]